MKNNSSKSRARKDWLFRKDRAFTLVEMIVSLAIFSIVAVVALGALIKIISANKKAQTVQSAITNLNFALESLSREMRVGTNYNCGSSFFLGSSLSSSNACDEMSNLGSGSYIAFQSTKVGTNEDSTSKCQLLTQYRFVPQSNGANPTTWSLENASQPFCDSPFVDGSFSPIISDNVTITSYKIKVVPKQYPLALIEISGYAGVREKERTYFDVQTALSSRSY